MYLIGKGFLSVKLSKGEASPTTPTSMEPSKRSTNYLLAIHITHQQHLLNAIFIEMGIGFNGDNKPFRLIDCSACVFRLRRISEKVLAPPPNTIS